MRQKWNFDKSAPSPGRSFRRISIAVFTPPWRAEDGMPSTHYLEIDPKGIAYREDTLLPMTDAGILHRTGILSGMQLARLNKLIWQIPDEPWRMPTQEDVLMELDLLVGAKRIIMSNDWSSREMRPSEKETWRFLSSLFGSVGFYESDKYEVGKDHEGARGYARYHWRRECLNRMLRCQIGNAWNRSIGTRR